MNQHLNANEKNEANIDFNQQYTLSDEHYYQLPVLVPSNFKGKRNQITFEKDIKHLDEDLQETASNTLAQLLNYIEVWDVDSDNDNHRYYFNIPPTCFHYKIKEFQLPKNFQAYEYNRVSNFNQNQLQQIFETGTFEVPSQQFPIPYVWQISSWVIKGRQNILNSYFHDMARSYKGYRTWQAYIAQDRDEIGRNMSLRSGMYNIAIRPVVIFSIFFGFKEMYSYANERKIKDNIEAQRQLELLKIQDINMELYNFLKLTLKDKNKNTVALDRYQKLISYANSFNDELNGLKLQMQNLYDLQNEKQQLLATEDEEKEEYNQNLLDQISQLNADYVTKYKIFIDKTIDINTQITQATYGAQKQFWQNSEFNKSIVNQLISLADCLRIYEYHYQIYQAQMRSAIANFVEQLKQQHKIKSKYYGFVDEETKKYKFGLKQQLKEQFVKNLFEDLKQQNLREFQLYEHYENCKKLMRENFKIEKAEEKERNKEPSIELVVSKQLFPPYEIYQDSGNYHLRRQKHYYVNSAKFGWKVRLMGVRYYVWTVNIIFWLCASAISGPVGIKALFGVSKFHPDVEIDRRTGVVKPSYFTVTPCYVNFCGVLEGMWNSRSYFESSADTGLFGKSFYRLFNLIEVYIFRFLLLGVFGFLILKPSIIIVSFVISVIMAITAWLWIPVTIVIRILFNSLIYDTDVYRRREKDIIWRSPNWCPLIINLMDFLMLGVLNSLFCLFKLIIWHPLLILFVTIFAQLRFYTRSCYDIFTLQIIRLLGRVPASQTNVAWKISGPGLSRQYFYGIKLPQVLILVQGNLEDTILTQYQNKLLKLIEEPSRQIRTKIQSFFNIFNASFNFTDPACSYLTSQLHRQLQERRQNFPRISHQIRFTEQELLFILKQVKQFIKSQIQLKDMHSFIWDSYNVNKGDYNQLAETIMSQIFGSSVLNPFEDLEMRFQLNIEQNFNFMSKIDKALDGQILFQLPSDYTIKQKGNGEQNKQVSKRFVHYSEVYLKFIDIRSYQKYGIVKMYISNGPQLITKIEDFMLISAQKQIYEIRKEILIIIIQQINNKSQTMQSKQQNESKNLISLESEIQRKKNTYSDDISYLYELNSEHQNQSSSQQQLSIETKQLIQNRLKQIYDFYIKIIVNTGPVGDFSRISEESQKMTEGKVMIFFRHFGILKDKLGQQKQCQVKEQMDKIEDTLTQKEISHQPYTHKWWLSNNRVIKPRSQISTLPLSFKQLNEEFKKISNFGKTINFQQFQLLVEKIAFLMFGQRNCLVRMYEYLEIDSNKFKSKLKLIQLPFNTKESEKNINNIQLKKNKRNVVLSPIIENNDKYQEKFQLQTRQKEEDNHPQSFNSQSSILTSEQTNESKSFQPIQSSISQKKLSTIIRERIQIFTENRPKVNNMVSSTFDENITANEINNIEKKFEANYHYQMRPNNRSISQQQFQQNKIIGNNLYPKLKDLLQKS